MWEASRAVRRPKREEPEETCGNCRYSKCVGDEWDMKISCRRYPPIVFDTRYADGAFPEMIKEDWCGEWGPE